MQAILVKVVKNGSSQALPYIQIVTENLLKFTTLCANVSHLLIEFQIKIQINFISVIQTVCKRRARNIGSQ